MTISLVDNPSDRPEWIRETIRLVTSGMESGRRSLLSLVDSASDMELIAGGPDGWGLGQVAVHLLLVERGVALIALRLARGEEAGPTGQPRPVATAATREAIHSLARKAAASGQRLAEEFPAEPDVTRTAAHPFYGPQNCFGWLLSLPNHYSAHLEALAERRPSSL